MWFQDFLRPSPCARLRLRLRLRLQKKKDRPTDTGRKSRQKARYPWPASWRMAVGKLSWSDLLNEVLLCFAFKRFCFPANMLAQKPCTCPSLENRHSLEQGPFCDSLRHGIQSRRHQTQSWLAIPKVIIQEVTKIPHQFGIEIPQSAQCMLTLMDSMTKKTLECISFKIFNFRFRWLQKRC